MFEAKIMSAAAIDVLGQLFVVGPTWDGNIISKAGRTELAHLGLAFHAFGWAALTEEGVRVAVEWDRNDLRRRHHDRWYTKLRSS